MRVRKHGKIPMLAWNKDFKPLQKIKGIVVINIAMHTYRIAVAGIAAVTVTWCVFSLLLFWNVN